MTNYKSICIHKDGRNLMQMIYQITIAYFEDDCVAELTSDPVFSTIFDKNGLTSQPIISDTLSILYNV